MNKRKYPLIAPIGSAMGINLIKAEAGEIIFNSEAHAEAVLAFYERFPEIDIAFSVMDTSIEARALGCNFEMKGRVPAISGHQFSTSDELSPLKTLEPEKNEAMSVNINAIKMIKRHIRKPLATYVVGPATLGAHLFGITNLIKFSRRNTEEFFEILDFTSVIVRDYAQALHRAGADSIIILEPQALIFSPDVYTSMLKKYVEEIAESLPDAVLHVCGDTGRHVESFASTDNVNTISLDWQVDISTVKKERLNKNKVLMGNIDPVEVLQKGKPESIQRAVIDLLKSMKDDDFILSTGCDMVPDTPEENLDAWIAAALSWRKEKK